MIDLIKSIRDQHRVCITRSCRENKCGLQVDGVQSEAVAIIHGARYQRHNGLTDKLCDRIIFCGLHGCVLAAVELKGGRNVRLTDAIAQIQNGLSVASGILQGHVVADWFPLLIFSGHVDPSGTRLLRTRQVEFRGRKKNVIKRDCGTRLSAVFQP